MPIILIETLFQFGQVTVVPNDASVSPSETVVAEVYSYINACEHEHLEYVIIERKTMQKMKRLISPCSSP